MVEAILLSLYSVAESEIFFPCQANEVMVMLPSNATPPHGDIARIHV